MIVVVTALTSTLLTLFPSSILTAAQERPTPGSASIQISTDRAWYSPDSMLSITVQTRASQDEVEEDIELTLFVYPSALTRSYLSYFRKGYRPYPRTIKKLGNLSREQIGSPRTFTFPLANLELKKGVYPFEVRAVFGDDSMASDYGMLVIMDLPPGSKPILLALVWSADFLPPTDFRGSPLDQALEIAVNPAGGGYLSTLATTIGQYRIPSSLVFPGQAIRYLERKANSTPTAREGRDEKEELLTHIRQLNEAGFLEIIPTTYSMADLDLLREVGLEEDARQQMELGREALEKAGLKLSGLAHPGFRLGSAQLEAAIQSGAAFSPVSPEVLRGTREGEKLLQGTTLAQPVWFSLKDGASLKCLVVDDILYNLLTSTIRSDSLMLVQDIMAELAVLQREKPAVERGCVLAFPPSFIPEKAFLEHLYSSLAGADWVEASTLKSLVERLTPIKNVHLLPHSSFKADEDFVSRLKALRERIGSFSTAIPEDQTLKSSLKELVLLLENYRFTEGINNAAAGRMLESGEEFVRELVSKIRIIRKRSVTLSGLKGSLAVNVVNDLGFPVKVVMRLENRNLVFPEGNEMEVTLLPRENQFIFPVEAHRKGSYLVDIALESDGADLDRTQITVNTSMINSLAIILLLSLTAFISLVSFFRWTSRAMRSGKHARRS